MRHALLTLLLVACGDKDTDPHSESPAGDCEVLEDVRCGHGAPEGEDTACPEGWSCWGPSAFQCYQGEGCNLPICLAADARIDTPEGPVPVRSLREGQLVWTVDAHGQPLAAPVLALGTTLAPAGHAVMDLALDDGRTLRASPGHPTADGRTLGALRIGDALDGGLVVRAERVPYDAPRTWDLLPAGPTGLYRADGVLLGSTLAPPGDPALAECDLDR